MDDSNKFDVLEGDVLAIREQKEFPTQLHIICASNEEDKGKIINASIRNLNDLFDATDYEEGLRELDLSLPTRMRIKKIKEAIVNLHQQARALVQDALETGGNPLEEEDMEGIGEHRVRERTEMVIQGKQRKEGIYQVILRSVNFDLIAVRAGVAMVDPVMDGLGRVIPGRLAGTLANSTSLWIGAAVVFSVQTIYHTYRYFKGEITAKQLIKYTVINAVAGGASVGGGIGGASFGASVGTMICPGIGTAIGGFLGAVIGSIVSGYSADRIASYFGNKMVNDEESFRILERKKQYKEALRVFQMVDKEVTRDKLEKRKRELYKLYHPDKHMESSKEEAKAAFLSVCAAYYCIMQEKGWNEGSSSQQAQMYSLGI